MDTIKLKAFCTVARLQSISKAADELAYTQPAISTQIRALENEYDVNLFSRTGNRVELTESGRQLLPVAQKLLDLFEESRQTVRKITEEEKLFIRIGASAMPGVYILPRLVEKFYKAYPKYTVSISIANALELEKMMLDNEVDVGIIGRLSPTSNPRSFIEEKLFDDPLVLVIGSNHPLANYTIVESHHLAGERLILPPTRTITRVSVENWFQDKNVAFSQVLEISNSEAIKRFIMCNLGISIMCQSMVTTEIKQGTLKTIPIKGLNILRGVYISYSDKKRISPATKQFVDFVYNTFNTTSSNQAT